MRQKINVMFILTILVFINSCKQSETVVSIPAYQKFVLGEMEEMGFSVDLVNLSDKQVKIETRNLYGKTTSGFGLPGKNDVTIYVPEDQMAVIVNPNDELVQVRAKFVGGIEGMRYQPISENDVEDINPLTDADLKPIVSDEWTGKLMYLDYSSGNEVDIPAALKVRMTKAKHYELEFIYPKEPGMNETSLAIIERRGTVFQKRKIIQCEESVDYFIIKMVEFGTDNREEAQLYYTIKFNASELIIEKEVQKLGDDDRLLRNRYTFTK